MELTTKTFNNGNKLSNEKIKEIIYDNLGKCWEIVSKKIINNRTCIDMIDNNGYLYGNVCVQDIKKYKPSKFHSSNLYTTYNIKNWIKINNLSIDLLSNLYIKSNENLTWECKKCNGVFKRSWDTVRGMKISCPHCDDGISYPEKYVKCFIDQLDEKHISQYSPEWAKNIIHPNLKLCGNKIYDEYLPRHKELWEIQGEQHNSSSVNSFSTISNKARTAIEEAENDKIKKELAEDNGYKYIEILAYKSEPEYMKNSIITNLAMARYDLSKIDWNKCHEYALNSLVKVCCQLFSSGDSAGEIATNLRISKPTVIKYLKHGTIIGWCKYNPDKEKSESNNLNKKKFSKQVVQLTIEYCFIQMFESCIEAQRKTRVANSSISYCCRGINKTAGGYRWMFYDDYLKLHSATDLKEVI